MKLDVAKEHLTKVIEEKPTGDALFKRGLCNALLGDNTAAMADLQKAKETGLSDAPQEASGRYRLAADLCGCPLDLMEPRAFQARKIADLKVRGYRG